MTPARVGEGLPKRCRLLRPAEFDRVLREGRRTRDECFAVFAAPNARPHLRVGLVVSRKVSAKAVVRNRVKRQIRESVRRRQQALKGFDVVVIAQSVAAAASPPALQASLARHWTSIIEECDGS